MTAKKILGYFFIVIAMVLTLAIIVLFPQFIKALFAIFKSHSDIYEIGYNLGFVTYWIIHITLTVILWIFGRRWIKSSKP